MGGVHYSAACVVLVTLLSLTGSTWSQMVPCDHIPLEGCTCWNPRRPHVSCNNMSLFYVPSRVSQMTISVLQLSHNIIRSLRANQLGPGLLQLDLDHNDINSIHIKAFDFCKSSLYTLKLDSNRFTTVPSTALKKLNNLHVLDLSNNRITWVRVDDFKGLFHLDVLHLEGNNLELEINQGSSALGRSGASLEQLAITLQGKDRVLDWDLRLGGVQFVKVFQLTDTDILRPLSDDDFWFYLTKLQYLGLHRCGLTSLDDVDIEGPVIHHLSLRENNITGVQGWVASEDFPRLKVLDLSYNQISRFQVQHQTSRGDLRKLPESLEQLNLRGNRLVLFDDKDVVVNLYNLELVDLRDNKLFQAEEIFQQLTVTPRPDLQVLISGNIFRCSCSHDHVIAAMTVQLKRGSGNFRQGELLHSLTCQTTEGAANKMAHLVTLCAPEKTNNTEKRSEWWD